MHTDRLRLSATLLLAIAAAAPSQAKAPSWRTNKIERTTAPKPFDLPPEATARLFVDAGPVARAPTAEALLRFVAGRVRRDPRGGLEVDRDGSSEKWLAIAAGSPTTVEWFDCGRFLHLQFFDRGRDWWVASAEAFEAKQGDLQVRILDADADGACWEPGDFIAWRSGTLRPIGVVTAVDDGTLAGDLRLVAKNRAIQLQFRETPRPEGIDEHQWVAFRSCNALRNRQGLPPTTIWVEANHGLTKHTQFLQFHAPNKSGTLDTYYGEGEGMPGYTAEGNMLSKAGCVAFLPEGMSTVDHVTSTLTMVQSRSDALAPGLTRFGYGRTQKWSFFRMEQIGPSGSRYAVIPAAGSRDVPTACASNWPFPRSFPDLYQRPRGLPISVQLPTAATGDGFRLRIRSIALFAEPDLREVPGFAFSVRDVAPSYPDDRFYFVPGSPLATESVYLVQATVEAARSSADGAGMTVDVELLQWQFRTGI